jgi:hypothetical protein
VGGFRHQRPLPASPIFLFSGRRVIFVEEEEEAFLHLEQFWQADIFQARDHYQFLESFSILLNQDNNISQLPGMGMSTSWLAFLLRCKQSFPLSRTGM